MPTKDFLINVSRQLVRIIDVVMHIKKYNILINFTMVDLGKMNIHTVNQEHLKFFNKLLLRMLMLQMLPFRPPIP
jgi:hypothetical protein